MNQKLPLTEKTPAAERGAAMIVALALVVLVTVVVVSFLLQARANQMVSGSSSVRSAVVAVADGNADYVVQQLSQTIVNASTNITNATNLGTAVAYRFSVTNALAFNISAGGAYPTLIKQSIAPVPINPTAFYPSLDTNASSDSSTNTVSSNRWTLPRLNTNAIPPTAPNWIYVSRTGGVTNQATNSTTNTTISRFAYNVYDLSGLLDANAIGAPTGVALQPQILGTLAGADLTAITGAGTNGNTFAMNRIGTNFSPAAYATYLTAAALAGTNALVTNSTVGTGTNQWVNTFLSRQDLINYCNDTNAHPGMTNLIPYLTHFSRHVNAPSWGPINTNGNPSFDYATLAIKNGANTVNRFIPSVPVPAGGFGPPSSPPRLTGESALEGETLVKYKFPLSRLSMFTATAPTDPTDPTVASINYLRAQNNTPTHPAPQLSPAQAIQQAFGLTYNQSAGSWIYNATAFITGNSSPADTTILPLGKVSGREPNFFELLKAGILSGSLGQGFPFDSSGKDRLSPVTGDGSTGDATSGPDQDTDRQIIQIGANIIDQADSDNVPTQIDFNSYATGNSPIRGDENTPKIYGFEFYTQRDATAGGVPAPTINAGILPILWNPHFGGNLGNTNVILKITGNLQLTYNINDGSGTAQTKTTNVTSWSPVTIAYGGSTPSAGTPGTTISGNVTSISDTNATLLNRAGSTFQYSVPSGTNVTFTLTDTANNTIDQVVFAPASTGTNVTQWNPAKNTNGLYDTPYYGPMILRLDPRTHRFGLMLYDTNTQSLPGNSIPTPNEGTPITFYAPAGTNGGSWANVTSKTYGTIANNTNTAVYYADPDGVTRFAEGAYTSFDTSKTGQNGPIILNRPFYSVGELGYVFRDLPWKNLDFYTANSADSGLLDIFTVNESPAIVGGRVNLNTPYGAVLNALMAPGDVTLTPLSTIGINGMGATFSNAVTNSGTIPPIMTAGGVTTNWSALAAGNAPTYFSSALYKINREALVRAVATQSDQRTANYLIDIITQTGQTKIRPSSATPVFIVTGERHLWVSVAIDRVTGKVVSKEIEAVQE